MGREPALDLAMPEGSVSTVLSTNQFKNGNHIEVDGTVFKVLEFQHVKPGKGGAFVRTKLRRAADGAVIDRTFRAGEKFRAVRTESRKMQFLYADGTDAHFMDSRVLRPARAPGGDVAGALRWIRPTEEIDLLFIDEPARRHQLPTRGRARGHRRPSRGSRATPPRAAATSPPRWKPARWSRCRCSSTSATACGWTRARATTCRGLSGMRRARDQRRAAVVALYQHDLTGRAGRRRSSSATPRPFTRGLAHATLDYQDELDEAIGRHAKGWGLDRIAPLERAILRTAPLEMLHPDVDDRPTTPIPPEGAIDEAVETAKKFCGTEAPGFVNGVLAAILRETRENRAAHG